MKEETDRSFFWRVFNQIREREKKAEFAVKDLFMRAAKAHGAINTETASGDARAFNKECKLKDTGVYRLPRYARNYIARCDTEKVAQKA